MHATIPRLVRIVPRSVAKAANAHITPHPAIKNRSGSELPPTVHEVLMRQRAEMGEAWPANVRIEPILTKKTFARVRPELRSDLKSIAKRER
ncbi:hypothetical protein PLICRDRAFT_590673 [Plicaturopsis crispa FD-325 SS-3]|nr:hypothetical protein PLICRDRAFT_590673 [Plicaturopsis crispa FD-325 SS-3]